MLLDITRRKSNQNHTNRKVECKMNVILMRFTASNRSLHTGREEPGKFKDDCNFPNQMKLYELTDVRTKELGITNIVSKETPFNGGDLLMP